MLTSSTNHQMLGSLLQVCRLLDIDAMSTNCLYKISDTEKSLWNLMTAIHLHK